MLSAFFGSSSKPKNPQLRRTELHNAIEAGDAKAFRKFFEDFGSAEIDVMDEQERTALTLAVILNRKEMAIELMNRLADPFLPRDVNKRTISMAVMHLERGNELITMVHDYSTDYRNRKNEMAVEKEALLVREKEAWQLINESPTNSPKHGSVTGNTSVKEEVSTKMQGGLG